MDKTRLRYLIAALLSLCLAGCSADDPAGGADEGGGVYLRFTLSVEGAGAATKAPPTGGEQGDGYEPATEDEYRVNDLLVFLVPHSNQEDELAMPLTKVYFSDLSGPDDGNIADGIDKIYTKTQRVDGLQVGEEYHIMTLANVGSDWEERCEFETLQDLFSGICEEQQAWMDGQRGFLMSSTEYVGKTFTVEANSSEQYPILTQPIFLRRLLARVDYQAKDSYITPDKTATDNPDAFAGTVTIEGAALVNCLTQGEYLFRRVADNVDQMENAQLWGLEKDDNWIVDPYPTSDKKEGYYANYFATFTEQDGWRDLLPEGTEVTDSGVAAWRRIGYVAENTNLIQSLDDLQHYATGVVFKAKFVPDKVRDEQGQEVDYVGEGTTFYRYNSRLYQTYKAIKNDFYNLPDDEPEAPSEYGVDKYEDGICYYTWWIKHNEDDDPDAFGPMEYAVARNNLYQLEVASVAGLGDPEPGTSSLIVKAAVKHWGVLNGQDVTLEEK